MGEVPQDHLAAPGTELPVCHRADADLPFPDVHAVRGTDPERRAEKFGLVLSRYIYKTAFEYKDMGYASAISLVLFVIIMILSLIEQKRSQVDWEY